MFILLSVVLGVRRHFNVSQKGPTHEDRSYIFYLQSIVSGKATLRQNNATAKAPPMSAPDIATLIQDAVSRAVTGALAQRWVLGKPLHEASAIGGG